MNGTILSTKSWYITAIDKEAGEASDVNIDMFDDDSDEIARSSVSEVMKWIAESNRNSR